MSPAKRTDRKHRARKASTTKGAGSLPTPPRDPNRPGARLRRFIEQALRADPGLTLPELLDATNAWAKQGHTHKGYVLWSGDRPFGPHYLGLLLREEWAARLGSGELRQQARFFRENPDKSLEDLARATQARLEAMRARDAAKRERLARKREQRAQRKKREEAERQAQHEREERDRRDRERRAAGQAAQRHAAALDRIIEFFHAAGIEAAANGGALRVAGVPVKVTRADVASRAKVDGLVDRVVWARHRELLLNGISRHLPGADELRAIAGTDGWILSHDRTPLAIVRATSAKAKSTPARPGNFLTVSAPWQALGDAIRALRAGPVRSRSTVPAPPKERLRRFAELPESMPAALRDLALTASHQLRTERNLVFAHAVELQDGGEAIRFAPLTQGPSYVEVPVTWSRWSDGAMANLAISGRRDPLPLAFRGEDDDAAVVRGWVLALVGYAQLVCREELADLLHARPRADSSGAGSSAGSGQARLLATAPRAWSLHRLTPVGRTRNWIASYVAGHRRRLRPGHAASPEARSRAARVGITLRQGETWVSPHVRGVPANAVLQFRWVAPTELSV
jgi:hypothetical protein